jgi:hypothetical protein
MGLLFTFTCSLGNKIAALLDERCGMENTVHIPIGSLLRDKMIIVTVTKLPLIMEHLLSTCPSTCRHISTQIIPSCFFNL